MNGKKHGTGKAFAWPLAAGSLLVGLLLGGALMGRRSERISLKEKHEAYEAGVFDGRIDRQLGQPTPTPTPVMRDTAWPEGPWDCYELAYRFLVEENQADLATRAVADRLIHESERLRDEEGKRLRNLNGGYR